MKEARRRICGVEGLQRCTQIRKNRAARTAAEAPCDAAKASSTSLEDSFLVSGNCRRTSYTLSDRRRFPCSPAVKLSTPWIASVRPPLRVGATDLMRRACSCQSDEAERKAHSVRAICEGEIELRGTIAAEEGGLHMGWNGTEVLSASAAGRCKCLRWFRFRLALLAHVRLAALQVRAQT